MNVALIFVFVRPRLLHSQDCFRPRLALPSFVAISIATAVSTSVRSVVPVLRVAVVLLIVGSRHRFRFCYSIVVVVVLPIL